MRVHPGELTGPGAAQPACQTLVGGLGLPGLRDLDFGRQVVRYLEHLEWPGGVVVEDLSCAAHLVLHRVQELRPAKVVLGGAAVRGAPPGSVRRYRLDLAPPPPDAVHEGLSASVNGMADLDHTLAVVRHWGGFPSDTVVVEVEPSDCSFGPGFSEELGDSIEQVLAMVREEVGGEGGEVGTQSEVSVDDLLAPGRRTPEPPGPGPEPASPELEHMVEHARLHERLRLIEPYGRAPLAVRAGERCMLRFEARSRPYGVGLGTGGDWYDIVPKPDGTVAVVLGDATGRGAEAAAIMSELRAAARAYAVLDDDTPSRLVERLDGLVAATGIGAGSTLAYLHVEPRSGRVRMSSAGQCSPLVSTGTGSASFVAPAASPALGPAGARRQELEFVLAPRSTLLLFTAGLVRAGRRSMAEGLEYARCAAARGPRPLDALCDHVFDACLGRSRREDDALVVALRLDPDAVPAPSPVSRPTTTS